MFKYDQIPNSYTTLKKTQAQMTDFLKPQKVLKHKSNSKNKIKINQKNYYFRQVLKKHEPVYQAIWAETTDFDEVLISPVMLQDHMPDKVLSALNKVFHLIYIKHFFECVIFNILFF